jgi:hypothetical protein
VRFASINQIQRADVRGNVMVGEILR